MATPTVAELLKYADLQLAAEALYSFNAVENGVNLIPGAIDKDVPIAAANLTRGNLHVSRFTATEAATFVDPVTGWKVVEHISNTTTGFSGTLFKNNRVE
jgi:hypothetical protein